MGDRLNAFVESQRAHAPASAGARQLAIARDWLSLNQEIGGPLTARPWPPSEALSPRFRALEATCQLAICLTDGRVAPERLDETIALAEAALPLADLADIAAARRPRLCDVRLALIVALRQRAWAALASGDDPQGRQDLDRARALGQDLPTGPTPHPVANFVYQPARQHALSLLCLGDVREPEPGWRSWKAR